MNGEHIDGDYICRKCKWGTNNNMEMIEHIAKKHNRFGDHKHFVTLSRRKELKMVIDPIE